MIRPVFLLGAALTLLSGCATLGGNVKGAFSCRAPEGSCAPTAVIDAQAMRSAGNPPGRPLALVKIPSGSLSIPTRTRERTIRIDFPAFVDARGVLHDQATAHAVVEGPAWATRPQSTHPEFSRSPAPSSLREAVAGATAPAIEGLEPLPTRAPHPDIAAENAGRPGQAALDAARTGHRIGSGPSLPSGAATLGLEHLHPTSPALPAPVPPSGSKRSFSSPGGDEPDLGDPFRSGPKPGEPR